MIILQEDVISNVPYLLLSGGYTTGPKEIIDLLRNRSRPYLFSNSLPPAVVGSASKVSNMFDILNEINYSMIIYSVNF